MSNSPQTIGLDELLARASKELPEGTLPAMAFGNAEVFDAEIDRIFGRCWVYLAHETEIPNSGDYVLRKIGTDPVLVTRDSSGGIHVMSNYCPHRATEICRADQGNASRFTCPYHGWTFKNTGDWIGAPFKGDAYKTIDKSKWGMHKAAQVDTHQGLIFATLDANAPPLKEYLGGAAWMLDAIMGMHPAGMECLNAPDRWIIKADWKNGAENFVGDNYHLPTAHASLAAAKIMDGTNEWVHYCVQYNFGQGHGFAGGRLPELYGEEWEYLGISKDLIETLDMSNLDEVQREMMKNSPPLVGTIFPNLTYCCFAGSPDPETQEIAVYISFRQWQPVSAGVTEVWSWMFTYKVFPQDYKDRAYSSGQNTFSVSGVFEQDDTVVWEGAAKAGRSLFSRKNGVSFNYQLGLEGMSNYPLDEDWKGPGTRYLSGFGEGNARSYYTRWLEEMLNKN